MASSSWVPGADTSNDFSLANLPLGIVSTPADPTPHAAVAIGPYILDLKALFPLSCPADEQDALLPTLSSQTAVFAGPTLNALAALGRPAHRELRAFLQALLASTTPHPHLLRDDEAVRARVLIPQAVVQMHLPMAIGDYTDFYAGYHHAHHVGVMFRGPANALQPNYTHLPVGYHGRASSVVVSGTPIVRPVGQMLPDPAAKVPVTGPTRKLDIELELGCFIAKGNAMGTSVSVQEAEDDFIFGYVLLNDWSARDVQTWEYVPLGPFNGKNFGTTVSGWVVVPEALEPFRCRGVENATELQGYLRGGREEGGVFDVKLEVDLTSEFSLFFFFLYTLYWTLGNGHG